MQDTRELIGMLNQGARPLSKGHRRIAEYIAQHYDKAVFMTAGALGPRMRRKREHRGAFCLRHGL